MTTSSFPGVKKTMAKGAIVALALVLAAPLSVVTADAKAGGGKSSGSRGSNTYSAPPSTPTAPGTAQPMQRTETRGPAMGNPGMGTAAAAQPGRFGGFGTGLAAGLLGAGLIGMLSGHGFLGGLGGLASIFGLLFQVALIGGLIWLALRFFRGRGRQPAYAAGPSPAAAGTGPAPGTYARTALGGLGGLGGGARSGIREAVEIGPSDFAAFERSLVEIQDAYGREDLSALSQLATPEMVRYFGADLEENRRRNVRNDVSEAKLLQGDLAESWREGDAEYATVAMRFTTLDTMVDRMSGRVISGNASVPSEATELWTFRREGGGPWALSAIQQTA
jgi:predicted lipid-binding transport protein (Tim44 family)